MVKKVDGFILLCLLFNSLNSADLASSVNTAGMFLGSNSSGWLSTTKIVHGYYVPAALLISNFCNTTELRLADLSATALPAFFQLLMLKQFETTQALDLNLKGCPVSAFIRTRTSTESLECARITRHEQEEAVYLQECYPTYQSLFGQYLKKSKTFHDLPHAAFRAGLQECHEKLGLKDPKLIAFATSLVPAERK